MTDIPLDAEHLWIGIGLAGQALFGARFLVQWIASERSKKSIVPLAFWYLSLGGGFILLSYAVYRMDPVFVIGQATGFLIYLRNIYLIFRERRDTALVD